jgi:hypothetical protein
MDRSLSSKFSFDSKKDKFRRHFVMSHSRERTLQSSRVARFRRSSTRNARYEVPWCVLGTKTTMREREERKKKKVIWARCLPSTPPQELQIVHSFEGDYEKVQSLPSSWGPLPSTLPSTESAVEVQFNPGRGGGMCAALRLRANRCDFRVGPTAHWE